jgi:uncharacterized protein
LAALVGFILSWVGPAVASAPEFPRPAGYVNDFAGVLSEPERDRLESFFTAADAKFGVQMTIVTLTDIGDEEPRDYANRLFETWKVGNKTTSRGLLLFYLARGAGKSYAWIEVGYGLEGVLNDGRIGQILDEDVVPFLRDGKADQAFASAARACLGPVLLETGEDPAQLDALLAADGYGGRRSPLRSGRTRLQPLIILVVIILSSLLNRRRYRGVGGFMGGGFGGFGGFGGGGFGGGGAGGFGGFGGGGSGGGGAGRGF